MVSVEEAPAAQRGYELEHGLVRLRAGRCPACGAVFCPTRLVCDGCGNRGLENVLLVPRGTIYTFTTVYQSTPEFRTPYHLLYVDFPEQVRVMLPAAGEEAPRIGATVEIVLERGPRLVDGELEEGPHALMVEGSVTAATWRNDDDGRR